MSSEVLLTASTVILESLSDGVYVCDRERRIVFWNRAAEKITGWEAKDVVGRRCSDGILCHVDKDGHLLCRTDFCPLQRAMITGTTSTVPIIVFAQCKDGRRIATQASVAPIYDSAGRVVGGVETFRDVSAELADLEAAKRVQNRSLETALPDDPRIRFTPLYVPHDIVGGDFYAIRQLGADFYGFLLADVMGHGITAALHAMQLSSLWEKHCDQLLEPAAFLTLVNNELTLAVKGESFATAICGIIDAQCRTLRLVSAGGPPGLVFRADGSVEPLESAGLPLGLTEDETYTEIQAQFAEGDVLLMFSDGAVEVRNAKGEPLGAAGLTRILGHIGYPDTPLQTASIEEQILLYSNEIRLTDDVTFIEVRFSRNSTGSVPAE